MSKAKLYLTFVAVKSVGDELKIIGASVKHTRIALAYDSVRNLFSKKEVSKLTNRPDW